MKSIKKVIINPLSFLKEKKGIAIIQNNSYDKKKFVTDIIYWNYLKGGKKNGPFDTSFHITTKSNKSYEDSLIKSLWTMTAMLDEKKLKALNEFQLVGVKKDNKK